MWPLQIVLCLACFTVKAGHGLRAQRSQSARPRQPISRHSALAPHAGGVELLRDLRDQQKVQTEKLEAASNPVNVLARGQRRASDVSGSFLTPGTPELPVTERFLRNSAQVPTIQAAPPTPLAGSDPTPRAVPRTVPRRAALAVANSPARVSSVAPHRSRARVPLTALCRIATR